MTLYPLLRRALMLSVFIPPLCASAGNDAHGHEWGYAGAKGPQQWGNLKPDYANCSLGRNQSPIDIRETKKEALAPIEFNYQPSALKIIDNGHAIQINYTEGSAITVDGSRYELLQFHFHKPSEERINGRSYAMVAHLVHRNAQGKLAVVAVLFKKGQENPLIKTLWSKLPKEKNKELIADGASIELASLLPQNQGYFTFTGSLTTPPCSEEVNWFVLKTPAEMSDAQIRQFGKRYRHNARPVQPLNARVVKESL